MVCGVKRLGTSTFLCPQKGPPRFPPEPRPKPRVLSSPSMARPRLGVAPLRNRPPCPSPLNGSAANPGVHRFALRPGFLHETSVLIHLKLILERAGNRSPQKMEHPPPIWARTDEGPLLEGGHGMEVTLHLVRRLAGGWKGHK
jgi:hypothetical protein